MQVFLILISGYVVIFKVSIRGTIRTPEICVLLSPKMNNGFILLPIFLMVALFWMFDSIMNPLPSLADVN